MTDELKTIMDGIAALGAEGRTVFIWWILYRAMNSVLYFIFFVFAVCAIVKTVRYGIDKDVE